MQLGVALAATLAAALAAHGCDGVAASKPARVASRKEAPDAARRTEVEARAAGRRQLGGSEAQGAGQRAGKFATAWQPALGPRPQLGVGPGRRDVRQHTDGFRRGTRSKTDDAVEHAAADDDVGSQRRRLDASGASLPAVAEHSERIGKVFATEHLSREGRRQNAAWRKKVDWYLRDGDAAGLHMDIARRFRQQTWAASRGG